MQIAPNIAHTAGLGYLGDVKTRSPGGLRGLERPRGIMRKSSESITRLLRDWRDGDEQAMDRLVPLVYEQLRSLARRELGRDRPGHSLQPTDLVHEAYARMVDLKLSWQNRVHFYRMAARTMRRVLVDHARARRADKRGGGAVKVTLAEIHGLPQQPASDVLELTEALDRLAAVDQRLSQAVELYYFGGLTYREIAHALEISAATVDRDLRFARSWLRRELVPTAEVGEARKAGETDGA